MRVDRLVVILSLLVIGGSQAALADNWGYPMMFSLIPHSGSGLFRNDTSAILGDGDIVENTPVILEQFLRQNRIPANTEIHLNSRGGDVDAGLKMGRIIRAHRLHTWVGGYDQWRHRSFKQMAESTGRDKYLAYCISSCTLAYLGGLERSMDIQSTYAVHQVKLECVNPNLPEQPIAVSTCLTVSSAQADIQSLYGQIITYVSEMSIDPRFIVEMTKAKPETVNDLSPEQMSQYKIITRPVSFHDIP